jgi:hypothetical protein
VSQRELPLFEEQRFLGEKETGKVREKRMPKGRRTAMGKGTETVTRKGMGRVIAS